MSKAILAAFAILALGAAALLGCGTWEDPAAQRARAEAERIRAEAARAQAESEARILEANAASDRRQAERDAALQRALELLPYVIAIGGGVLLAGAGMLMFWDLRSRAQQTPDLLLLAELRRFELAQAERDKEIWRALGRIVRPSLPGGAEGVILYDRRGRRIG